MLIAVVYKIAMVMFGRPERLGAIPQVRDTCRLLVMHYLPSWFYGRTEHRALRVTSLRAILGMWKYLIYTISRP
jgi:hypothetical protein